MNQSKEPVVQRSLASEAFRNSLDSDFRDEVFKELTEREPELALVIAAYERTALGSFARFRGSLSRKDCVAFSCELRNVACLIYRCLSSGYRELLRLEIAGEETNDA